MKKIIACLDGNSLDNSVCDYAIFISKSLNLEITFLHIIHMQAYAPNFLGLAAGSLIVNETSDIPYNINYKEPSKEELENANALLEKAKKYADSRGIISTTQAVHGDYLDTLLEYENVHSFVIPLEKDDEEIRDNVAVLLREVKAPILFINKAFTPIKTVLLAFDGHEASIRTLNFIQNSKIFGDDLNYHIININKSKEDSEKILSKAKTILKNKNAKYITLCSGEIAEEIIKYRRSNNIDIIATGAYTRGIISSFFFGSTSKEIVNNAIVPILCVGKL
ncbi:universal stress protein [Campylobacter blaseri]|uniref:UspA domain-containing protein n=1 Tax=Campylobacter blaseri TaxID=2042961 RepID=A0A2P8R3C1_9BACT|nr:universal stress protein [Campylobacter blaseri]PSM52996.1 hypothetical protein CQ405_00105 [Campylobacter blaseri]PSM54463.1 hypothetical protein CRN67_00105 [Campylobacter blaseri]QKF85293.1 universal stress protein [Campylobacter blaseri]